VARWLEALPGHVIHASVPLSLSSAWVAGLSGRRAAMHGHLDRALALPHAGPLPDGASSREAVAELIQTLFPFDDLSAGLHHARRTLDIGQETSPWWPLALLVAGLWTLYRDGPTDEAIEVLGQAADAAEGTPQLMVMVTAPALRALGHLQRGEFDAAEACAREAARRRAELDVGDIPQATHSWFATACVHRMSGRLAEARRDAETAVALVAAVPPEADLTFWAAPALIELARVRIAEGDLPGARAALRSARERLEGAADAGRLQDWLVEAEGAARVGGGVPPATGEPLSDREQAVLRMLAGPLSLRNVGAELFVSHNTVKAHARAIYRKLGVASRRDAVTVARERGLL
jgi:LuxR family maltose regulon positive regulatory protein